MHRQQEKGPGLVYIFIAIAVIVGLFALKEKVKAFAAAEEARRAEDARRCARAAVPPDADKWTVKSDDPGIAWKQALAALPEITPEKYPDSDEVGVYFWSETEFRADGSYTCESHWLSKILTDRGLADNKSFSFGNDDFYGSRTVTLARIHAADGSVRDIDIGKNLNEAADPSSLSSNIHDSHDRRLTLALPGVGTGDSVEIVFREEITKPRCQGVYCDYQTFESKSPNLWQGVQYTGPADMPLRGPARRDAAELDFRTFEDESAEGVRSVRYTVHDVPRYHPEPDMPPAYTCTARLLVSTAADWTDISRWYAGLCEKHLACTNAAMAALVAEIAPPEAPREKRIRAVFDFVSRDVRYMGVTAEDTAPGYEPHDVSLTFDNRYGVCRDKAALLVALMRLAGFEAWPVLINVGPKKDPDVPQPYFNHAIVAIASPEGDGSGEPYILMDPTNESTAALLPEYLHEKSYLVARSEGDTIRETPPMPAEKNMVTSEVRRTLKPNRTLDVSAHLGFSGFNDTAYRGAFAARPREALRSFMASAARRSVDCATLASWKISPENLRKDTAPLAVDLAFSVAEAARPVTGPNGGTTLLFDDSCVASEMSIVSRLLGSFGLEKRRFPVETGYPCGFRETVAFEFPEGVEFVAPEPVLFNTNGVFFSVRTDGDRVTTELKLEKSTYSPEEYLSLRELIETIERCGRAPGMARTSAADAGPEFGSDLGNVVSNAAPHEISDDVYCDSCVVTYDLRDAPRSWTRTAEFRRTANTYAGQNDISDLRIDFSPATCDVVVTNAFVDIPGEGRKEIDYARDVFVTDQAWVSSAPRYPAGKIMTVSFPNCTPGVSVEYTTIRRMHDCDCFSVAADVGMFGAFGELTVNVIGTNECARSVRLIRPHWDSPANRFEPNVATNGETVTYTVHGERRSTVAGEDAMPPSSRLLPRIEGYDRTAAEIADAFRARIRGLSDPSVETNAAAFARTLVGDGATTAEKAVAVRNWTALNMRRAGPSHTGLPLRFLSHADTTFADRYGNAADLRILECAMLRALDVEPEILLYNSDWDANPIPDYTRGGQSTFDTVSLRVADGTSSADLRLSGSSQYAPLGVNNCQGRVYFDENNEPRVDDAAFGESAKRYKAPDAKEHFTEIDVRADGSAEIRRRIEYSGVAYEAFNKLYSEMLPEEFRRHVMETVAGMYQSAELVGDFDVETRDADGCRTCSFTISVPDFAVVRGGSLTFTLPDPLAFSPSAEERGFPFRRTARHSAATHVKVSYPEGFAVDVMPRTWRFDDGNVGVKFERTAELDEAAREIRIDSSMLLSPKEFDSSLYAGFLLESLRTRGRDANTVTLAPAN